MSGEDGGTRFPPSFACPACHWLFPATTDLLDGYFSQPTSKCPKCGEPFDVWELTLGHFREGGYLWGGLSVLGVQVSALRTHLRRGEMTELDLDAHGVPPDARILAVGYTPGPPGGLFPAEFHGNWPPRHTIAHKLKLYPVPMGEGAPETPVQVAVLWVRPGKSAYVWQSFADASEQYLNGKYDAMLVPANVAAEFSIGLVIAMFLSQFSKRERLDRFMQEEATYGAQLNVLLPMLAGILGASALPEHIHTLLNRLRKLRNEIAHKGLLSQPLSQEEAANLLTAALFGVRYALMIGRRMVGSESTKDTTQDERG